MPRPNGARLATSKSKSDSSKKLDASKAAACIGSESLAACVTVEPMCGVAPPFEDVLTAGRSALANDANVEVGPGRTLAEYVVEELGTIVGAAVDAVTMVGLFADKTDADRLAIPMTLRPAKSWSTPR